MNNYLKSSFVLQNRPVQDQPKQETRQRVQPVVIGSIESRKPLMDFCPEGAFCVGRLKIFGVRAFVCPFVRLFVRPSRHFLLIFKIRIGCKIDFGCSKSELLAKHRILARFGNVQTIEATVACSGSKLIQALFLEINKIYSENDSISEYYVF